MSRSSGVPPVHRSRGLRVWLAAARRSGPGPGRLFDEILAVVGTSHYRGRFGVDW
jgi:hypothetical protein